MISMRLVSHFNNGPIRHAKLCVLIKDNIVHLHFMAVLCVLRYHVQAVLFHRNSRGVCVEVSYFFFCQGETGRSGQQWSDVQTRSKLFQFRQRKTFSILTCHIAYWEGGNIVSDYLVHTLLSQRTCFTCDPMLILYCSEVILQLSSKAAGAQACCKWTDDVSGQH